MTISTTTRKAGPYTGNGSATSFTFAFKVFAATDVLVIKTDLVTQTDTTLVNGTGYTVTLNANQNTAPGGSITVTPAISNRYTLTILSAVPNLQPVDLTANGKFYPEVINAALDRQVAQVQQLAEQAQRALTIPVTTSGLSATLPKPDALKHLRWNAAADALENADVDTRAILASVAHSVEKQWTAPGQTIFYLTNSYLPGTNSIQVELNGAVLTSGDHYTETDANTITLVEQADDVERIVFKTDSFVNSPASSAASVAYTPGTSTAQATNVSAYLNLSVKGLKRSFCAVGDGATDDYAKIAAALTTTGKIIEIEDGTYLSSANLPAPTCSQIVGWGEDVSILKAGAAVTRLMSVGGANYTRVFKDFKADGTLSNNAVGLYFGYGGSCSVNVQNVRSVNFKGTLGTGVTIGDVLKSKFSRLVAQGNGTGMVTKKISSGFPTTTTFEASVFSDSTFSGVSLIDGEHLMFTGGTAFESNGTEGALLLPVSGGKLSQVIFDDAWFEANYWNATFAGGASNGLVIVGGGTGYTAGDVLTVTGGTYSTAMQITVDTVASGVITSAHVSQGGSHTAFPAMAFSVTGGTGSGATFKLGFHIRCGDGTSLGGARIWPEFRATRFSMSTASCRAIWLDGSAVSASMKVPNFDSVLYPSMVVTNSAVCDLYDSNEKYDYSITVADTGNRCNYALDGWKDYTPTFATNVGNAAASFASGPTIAHSRFRKQDKALHVTCNFSGTLLAITPTNINVTLPTNLTIARNTNIAINIDIGGTKQTARLATDISTNKLYIQKPDLSTWASGATFTVMFDAIFEIS